MKNKFKEKLDSFLAWIGGEVHLLAMRDSLMSMIPFLALSGIATFFAYVLLDTSFVTDSLDPTTIANIQSFFVRIGNGCMNLMAVMLVVMIPYFLGRQKGFNNPIILGVTGLSMFMIFNPLDGGTGYFGTQGVLLSMIIGLTSAELFMRLAKIEKLKINVGDNVPQAVKDAFNSLLIILILIVVYALAATTLSVATGLEAIELISDVLQKPLVGIGATLPGAIIYTIIQTLLFAVGIHPGAIVAPIEAVFITAGLEGHIVNYTFVTTFGQMGGTGACAGLVVVLIFLAKRKEFRTLGKLAVVSDAFNINEPITFGVPIAFNPILIVPYVLVPLVNIVLAYFATVAGLIAVYSNTVTWSTPIFLKSIVGANGDIRNVIMELVCLVIDIFIWWFFMRIYEKQLDSQEAIAIEN
ncbi:PTS sugar transporter subunit IIC [Breznakia pachnodae]|uniref:Permease IIC component n=1 Tax=Breznakia pachnodae TaxID=265178 RepID=A0ABU0E4P8_9FIRM|nr:PTS transporter subunit EIIC [Breznakia pachnodae]MDQ0361475.1 PTS system cellobiose-specific IIC component [Breznakia pachnodae]